MGLSILTKFYMGLLQVFHRLIGFDLIDLTFQRDLPEYLFAVEPVKSEVCSVVLISRTQSKVLIIVFDELGWVRVHIGRPVLRNA